MIKPRTVIVFGPQASGKTLNGEALCRMYGCLGVNDEGKVCGKFKIKQGYLNLMIYAPEAVANDWAVVDIRDALSELGVSPI